MLSPLRWGCLVWLIIVSAVGAVFYTSTPTEPANTDATAPYFALENGTILYDAVPTLDNCNHIISGTVHDINGHPFTQFVVNIRMLLYEGTPPADGAHFPGSGSELLSSSPDDPSSWDFLLPTWYVDYEIWLTDSIGGVELSPHILVPARHCDQNHAIVNFVQIR